jgi:hypothetical protein
MMVDYSMLTVSVRSDTDRCGRLLLTVAALFENSSADDQVGWRARLTAYQEQLREWAESYPPTFTTPR